MTALLDQALAAGAEAGGIFGAWCEEIAPGRGPAACAGAGPAAALLAQFRDLAAAGELEVCPHLDPRRPRPAVWAAWQPASLWCVPCATAHRFGGIEGTEEDRRCDHCGTVRPVIHPYRALVPAVVAPGLGVATPPVLVLAGLCPACHRADLAAREREQAVPWN